MNSESSDSDEILGHNVCGFHQYALGGQPHLTYASRNLCEMVGYGEDELLDDSRDAYALLVHPNDRKRYAEFLGRFADTEAALTCDYRLIRKDGAAVYVRDSFTSKRAADGTVAGYSVLTDITDIKNENSNLRFLNETIPCGLLKYTCEKQPKITYLNQTMLDMLRFPAVKNGELDYLELYTSNIFLMVPMEERRRFSKYLDRVYASSVPIAGEMQVLRCDGTRASLFGWVAKSVDDQGVEEFQSVCIDVTERHKKKKDIEIKRYLKALTEIYDTIFEVGISAGTITCLHCNEDSPFRRFECVAMQIDDVLDRWILGTVDAADRNRFGAFFRKFCRKPSYESYANPPQITYDVMTADGSLRRCSGAFIEMDENVILYCCRFIHESVNSGQPPAEHDQLRTNIKDIFMRFSDGIAAFEISPDDEVKPLYASENALKFFGYTREEWLPLMEKPTPLATFIRNSKVTYEACMEFFRNGGAEFAYFDYETKKERRLRAICSQREPNSNSVRYVMLYDVENGGAGGRRPVAEKQVVSIRTFGYFDVFVGNKPIPFRNKKAKELLALLVDRRGGYVSSDEAIGFLWEDEIPTAITLSRYRKVALRLRNTLEEYGISDIVESQDGNRRIVPEKVACDLYEYLSGSEEGLQLFKGSYLTNYSWAESTLGELVKR